MAFRARLSAPQPEPPNEWPYHTAQWTVLPLRFLAEGERRLEAENYLSSGYGIRLSIEARPAGWQRLVERANVWQPSRLKGIQVSPEFGTPFLAATQVFEFRATPRKWLALERTEGASGRFVKRGTILVTCSGSVGRAILAFAPHLNTLITHDLLRVEVHDDKWWGWLYAYLRAPKSRAMMTSSRYGHIIKHLETSHLNNLPIPTLKDSLLKDFSHRAHEILQLREKAHAAAIEAEAHFEKCVGEFSFSNFGESGFVVRATKTMFGHGKRLDASRHNPLASALCAYLAKNGRTTTCLADCGFDIWVPGRYKRVPAEDGVTFVDSSDLFEISPDTDKRFADCKFGDEWNGRVKLGWLLMASSGQTYGLIGGAVLSSPFYEGKVVANHVIRIAARSDATARPGYVLTALTHPRLGRPLVKSLAFGSSVPEISPDDVAQLELVRLPKGDEDHIANLAEKSAELRGKADVLENELASEADSILGRFIAGESVG